MKIYLQKWQIFWQVCTQRQYNYKQYLIYNFFKISSQADAQSQWLDVRGSGSLPVLSEQLYIQIHI